MSTESDAIDPNAISAEQFAQMVAGAGDEDIERVIHQVGTTPTLDRIFKGFEERFVPDRAGGVDADIQWVVRDAGEEHPYVVGVHDGTCTARSGKADAPKVTFTLDLVPFVRLVTGQADGMKLFMTGKLKLIGDMMFATRVNGFFEPPKA
ncbi:MAG: SCP2 sterol-binding domain-containing protein [Actinomycetota bacterium]|nr:SCP2 sterol-binding domain-containing protein [Actinomycetota bacterium]